MPEGARVRRVSCRNLLVFLLLSLPNRASTPLAARRSASPLAPTRRTAWACRGQRLAFCPRFSGGSVRRSEAKSDEGGERSEENVHGITDIQTSSQAAEALRPIAGQFAFSVFALGIIGTGMLALPVLSGSSAYALGEALRWPVGLARQPLKAKAFYGTIAAATLVGGVLNFTPIDPVKALFWSAVINGVVAVPVMVMTMRMATSKKIMGKFQVRGLLRALGWLATATMAVAAIGMFAV